MLIIRSDSYIVGGSESWRFVGGNLNIALNMAEVGSIVVVTGEELGKGCLKYRDSSKRRRISNWSDLVLKE